MLLPKKQKKKAREHNSDPIFIHLCEIRKIPTCIHQFATYIWNLP